MLKVTRSAKVTFLPEGAVFTAELGETLAAVCFRAGRDLQTQCGGNGKCGKCAVKTDRGAVLACQTRIDGDITCEVPLKKEEITIPKPASPPTSSAESPTPTPSAPPTCGLSPRTQSETS